MRRMNMSTNVRPRNPNRRPSNILSFFGSIVLAIVGFILSQPFLWIVIIFGHNFHHITFPIFFMLAGFMIGAPMFLFGVISMFTVRNYGSSNTTNLDIGRIRYTIETDHTERK